MTTPVKGKHASVVAEGRGTKFRVGTVAVLASVAAAGVLAFASVTGSDGEPSTSGATPSADTAVAVPVSTAAEASVEAIEADPADGESDGGPLVLNGPANVQAGSDATFAVTWTTDEGEPVDGAVDLQRVVGNTWVTLTQVPVKGGSGTVDVRVEAPTIYRLAYGGSDELEAAESAELVVTTGRPLNSRITATIEKADDDTVSVTSAWTTDGGVPIVGELQLERASGDAWEPVSKVTTGEDGIGSVEVDAEQTTRFRFSYPGGRRFGDVVSDEATLADDVRAIPVSTCTTTGGIDGLGNGAGCHWTPVTVGTFVVGHDYLGNAWWNSAPMGSKIELTGKQAGMYEVVDRVIAPARGAALGSAADWWCDDECDVVLQTCQGQNTGFTWLRRVEDAPA